jgi:hypothetical protein
LGDADSIVPSSGTLAQLQVDAKLGGDMAIAATKTASLVLFAPMTRLS